MKKIRQKIISFVIIGVVGLGLAITEAIRGGDGFVLYFGIALALVSIINIIRFAQISKNPEQAKRFENTQNDERYIAIAQKSGWYTFLVSVFAEIIIAVILMFLNLTAIAQTIASIAAVQAFIYSIFAMILYKKY